MENEGFKCSGDCLQCSPAQRQYCASQNAHDMLRVVESLQKSVEVLSDKVDAMQSSEALFNPNSGVSEIPTEQ